MMAATKTSCYILYFLVGLSFIMDSCQLKKNHDHTQHPDTKLYAFVKDFVATHQNMYSSPGETQKAKKEFFLLFKKKMNEGLLDDIPFRFTYYTSTYTLAHFRTKICDKDSTFSLELSVDFHMAPEIFNKYNLQEEDSCYIKATWYRNTDQRLISQGDNFDINDIYSYYFYGNFLHARIMQLNNQYIDTIIKKP